MFEFKLPDLGEGIHEGEVLKWHVKVGDTIKEDDPLIEIETDKAAVTIPSPRGGIIMTLKGEVGDILNVGDVIVTIDDGNGVSVAPTETKTEEVVETPVKVEALALSAKKVEALEVESGRPVPAAPATRRLARELGVNINIIKGTGPAGRVTLEDVKLIASGEALAVADQAAKAEAVEKDDSCAVAEFAAHASTAIPFLDIDPMPDFAKEGPIEIEKLRSIRRKVAHKMTTSKILIPHVVHMDEADVTELDKFRREENALREGQGGKFTLLPFVIKAVIAGLKEYPALNASLDPLKEEIIYKKYYNMGVAVDSDRGLIVPVIKNADQKNIIQLSDKIVELAEGARNGNINVADLSGGTFTITNIGPIGGTGFAAAINYPEAAIIGLARAQDKPVVRDGEIVIRKMLPISLSFDHRIADGADVARMVSGIIKRLSDPYTLLLEI
ncbi:MAG: dihydrolipoamide acetyltransferase family protein [Candidatus Hatepunaea meridiana]|nr:dihydrolipoamide acetyltransferase family protein [Candidatus Hatepunaea meridiana]